MFCSELLLFIFLFFSFPSFTLISLRLLTSKIIVLKINYYCIFQIRVTYHPHSLPLLRPSFLYFYNSPPPPPLPLPLLILSSPPLFTLHSSAYSFLPVVFFLFPLQYPLPSRPSLFLDYLQVPIIFSPPPPPSLSLSLSPSLSLHPLSLSLSPSPSPHYFIHSPHIVPPSFGLLHTLIQ